MKTIFLIEHIRYIIPPKRAYIRGSFDLSREASATFEAAASQDFAAIGARIALHEAMFNFALAFVWLIGTFWHIIP